jgi:2,4-dienoyl-CoA reductase-like NADH-dependent reductase (Old Yellow Enzyme family)
MRESPIRASRPDILKPGDEAYFRDIGALFKAGLKIPVIVTGGMRSRAVMEEVLSRGEADLIGLARPFIREPELPNKFKAGKAKADCISCSKCYNHLQYETIECLSRGQAPPAAWGQAPPAWGQAPLA